MYLTLLNIDLPVKFLGRLISMSVTFFATRLNRICESWIFFPACIRVGFMTAEGTGTLRMRYVDRLGRCVYSMCTVRYVLRVPVQSCTCTTTSTISGKNRTPCTYSYTHSPGFDTDGTEGRTAGTGTLYEAEGSSPWRLGERSPIRDRTKPCGAVPPRADERRLPRHPDSRIRQGSRKRHDKGVGTHTPTRPHSTHGEREAVAAPPATPRKSPYPSPSLRLRDSFVLAQAPPAPGRGARSGYAQVVRFSPAAGRNHLVEGLHVGVVVGFAHPVALSSP